MTQKTAVLLMAYGTPRTPAEIEPYYTDIRRGRAPTPEQLADLVARYDAIGGISPLAARIGISFCDTPCRSGCGPVYLRTY